MRNSFIKILKVIPNKSHQIKLNIIKLHIIKL